MIHVRIVVIFCLCDIFLCDALNVTDRPRVKIVPEESCRKDKGCIFKCCPLGEYLYNKRYCVPSQENQTNLIEFSESPLYFLDNPVKSVIFADKFKIKTGITCADKYVGHIPVYLQEDGKLYIKVPEQIPPWEIRGPDKYCLDTFVSEDAAGIKTSKLNALLCFDDDNRQPHYVLSSTCMLISCLFILATLAVYIWLPELHTLHGWVLVAYLACFFIGFLMMATMQILVMKENITMTHCNVLTFLIYFFLLSAFFWLNIMCFDIWWTFSGKRGMSMEKMSTQRRFRTYSLYAFGIPVLLTILLVSLEYSGLPKNPWMPNIREGSCFLDGRSKLLYLYGPIVILCVANMIFFTLTAMKIANIKRQTAMLKTKESASTKRNKQRLLLYVKLFVLMGVNWLLEVVSAIFPELEYLWRFTDAYNVLLGVIIFIIFVCKRKILALIKKRITPGYRSTDNESITMKQFTRLRDFQRDSVDTIRTVVDSDSLKTLQSKRL